MVLGLRHFLSPVFPIIPNFGLAHIPSRDGTNQTFRFTFKDYRQISSPEGWAKGCIVSLFGAADKRSNGKYLFCLIGLNAMVQLYVQCITLIPFEIRYPHKAPPSVLHSMAEWQVIVKRRFAPIWTLRTFCTNAP
jgi:hypothetical protein